MSDWTPEAEDAGRFAFDHYRIKRVGPVSWDWADMSDWEKQQWIEHAKTTPERGSLPRSLSERR